MPRDSASSPVSASTTVAIVLALIVLLVGGPVSTAAAQSAGRPVDVVIVLDRSNSMADHHPDLGAVMEAIPDRLPDGSGDVRYALLTYTDSVRTEQGWTADLGAIEASIPTTTSGHVENASKALLAATEMSGRDNAKRVVILLTDEDDDAPPAARAAAEHALSSTTFLAISPRTASASACSAHDPPCDSSADNELKTIAGDSGGAWVNASATSATILDQMAATVSSQVGPGTVESGSSTDGADTPGGPPAVTGPSDDSDRSATLYVSSLTSNRTTVTVGQPVRITGSIENLDWIPGFPHLDLVRDGQRLDRTPVPLLPHESKNVSTVRRFDAPGSYEFQLENRSIEVNVTPPEPVVLTNVSAGILEAHVTGGTANGSVSIPLSGLGSPNGTMARPTSLQIALNRDVDFDLWVGSRPSPLPDTQTVTGVNAGAIYLTTNGTLDPAAIAHVNLTYDAEQPGVAVFRYDGDAGSWVRLADRAVNASSGARRTVTASGLDQFAIAEPGAKLAVDGFELDKHAVTVGEPVQATVTIENRGLVAGTYDVRLRADGTVVASTTVTVDAGDTRHATVTYVPGHAGEVQLAAGGAKAQSLAVNQATTPTETAVQETSTTGQPGFGILAGLLALSALLVLARRLG